jgi:hypothetical protein
MIRWVADLRARIDGFSLLDWAGRPLTAVLLRELLVVMRFKRFAALLLTLAVGLLCAILFHLGHLIAGTLPPPVAITNIVGLQCSALLLILFLVVPALSTVMVMADRQEGTLELLQLALEDPYSVLVGKGLALLAVFSAYYIALLPFSTFTYFFAGVEIRSFFLITIMLFGTAACHSAIGILLALVCRTTTLALCSTYAAVFLIYAVPAWFVGQVGLGTFSPNLRFLPVYFDPLALLRDLLHSLASGVDCLYFFGYQCLAVGCLGLVVLLLHRRVSLTALPPRQADLARPVTKMGDPIPPVPDWRNVIYHKERHTTRLARPAWMALSLLLGLVAALGFSYWSVREARFSLTGADLGTLVLLIVTPLLVLERCGREIDPSALVLLRLSRLTSEHVLLGKLYGVLHGLAPLTLGLMAGTVLPVPLGLTDGLPATIATGALNHVLYAASLLPLKLALFALLSLAVVRFRAPNTTDLAMTLLLAVLGSAAMESVRAGLFDVGETFHFLSIQFILIFGCQVIIGAFGGLILMLIALMRFEEVFDEGSDIFAERQVDVGR